MSRLSERSRRGRSRRHLALALATAASVALSSAAPVLMTGALTAALTGIMGGATGGEAHAQGRGDLEEDILDAARLLASWRFEEARTRIEAIAKAAPSAAEAHYLRGELAFLDGDYEQAIDHLAGMDDDAVGGNVGALRKLVRSTHQATTGFKKVLSSGGHFEIAYPPGKDEAIVELTGEVLEAAHRAMSEDFGYLPPDKVRIEILPAPSSLAQVSTLTVKEIETTGTIALCKYNKLMVVTPRATVLGYPWMDTIVHEYVHYVVSRMSHDRVPVWLQEGLARFEQTRWREAAGQPLSAADESLLAGALKKNGLISFDDMHPSMAKLPSQKAAALAFAEVATMVAYLHKEAGYPGLRRVIHSIKAGKNARRAVAEVQKRTWAEVEKGWKQYLKSATLRSQPSAATRADAGRIRFRKGASDDNNVGSETIASDKARKHARLGGLLRARGMTRAAAIEYEKAHTAAGGTDAFVMGKLSRTYLELGQHDRAIALAAPLLAADDSNAAAAVTLGMAYEATGKHSQAVSSFEVALRISPYDPAVRCGLAEAYTQLGKTSLAKRETHACQLVRE